MPAPSTLVLFALAALVLVAIPGPNHVYIVTRSITQGRRAGLASAFGVETGTLVHITAAAIGLSAVIASSTVAFNIVKYLGAGYLLWLGLRTLLRAEPLELDTALTRSPIRRIFAEGVIVNVLNPKVALFFLAFLPQFLDPGRGALPVQILVLGLILVVLATGSDVLYAITADALGGWLRRRPAFLRRQHYLTGGVYLALGAAAALTGERRHP